MTEITAILALIWTGAVTVFFGVIIGGLLVYRTKRDSHETFMPAKNKISQTPVNIDDFMTQPDEETDTVTDMFSEQNTKFLDQMREGSHG